MKLITLSPRFSQFMFLKKLKAFSPMFLSIVGRFACRDLMPLPMKVITFFPSPTITFFPSPTQLNACQTATIAWMIFGMFSLIFGIASINPFPSVTMMFMPVSRILGALSLMIPAMLITI